MTNCKAGEHTSQIRNVAMYDAILVGGMVLDPEREVHERLDVAIKAGRVAEISKTIESAEAKTVYDVHGCLVCPGFIDFHTHVYWGGAWGVNADEVAPRSGVTTFVDFGTAGPGNFSGFFHHVIRPSRVRILAFLHIAFNGVNGAICYRYARRSMGELKDIRAAVVELAIDVGKKYPDIIRGVKVRTSLEASENNDLSATELAKQAADALGLPVAIHIGNPPPTVREVLPLLERDDILTHAFRGSTNSLLDDKGKVLKEAKEARERGVLFDIGHGSKSFSAIAASRIMEEGLFPEIISSDIHLYSINGPAHDLAITMRKFMALGMSLERVVKAVTKTPASALGLGSSLGRLCVGGPADITVIRRETKQETFTDTNGVEFHGTEGFRIQMTLKDGVSLQYAPS